MFLDLCVIAFGLSLPSGQLQSIGPVGLPFKASRICLWGPHEKSINEVNKQLSFAAKLI